MSEHIGPKDNDELTGSDAKQNSETEGDDQAALELEHFEDGGNIGDETIVLTPGDTNHLWQMRHPGQKPVEKHTTRDELYRTKPDEENQNG